MPRPAGVVGGKVPDRVYALKRLDPEPKLLLEVRTLALHLPLTGAQLLELVVLVPDVQVVVTDLVTL